MAPYVTRVAWQVMHHGVHNIYNMFISYSWYNNEMAQIQMKNMPKKLQYTCIIYEQYTEWRDNNASWRDDMETLPTSPTLCWSNGGFPA